MLKTEWTEQGFINEPAEAGVDLKKEIRRLCEEKNAIVLASNRCAVTIPLCDKGDIISIKHITASVGKACGFTASNTLEGSSTETTSNAMSTFTVSSDGDVTLKPTGSTIIYSISIFHP